MPSRKKKVVRKKSNVRSKAKPKAKPRAKHRAKPVRAKPEVRLSAATRRRTSPQFRLGLIFRNLVLFVLLFLISYILSVVSENGVFINLFDFFWIIFGFISLAFFIALLILLFLKWFKK